jgi:hypothetical protein
MGRNQKKRKAGRVCRGQGFQWQAIVRQARQKWLNRLVVFDLHQGEGMMRGKVVSISDEGDVFVACLPGYDQRVPGLVMSLGFLDRALTLVDE